MTWVTAADLQNLPGMPGCTKRRRELLERNDVAKRQRTGRGGGFEYRVADLPETAQQALASRSVGAVKPVVQALEAGRQATQAQQVQAAASSMARLGQQLERAGAFDPARNPRLDLFQRFEGFHRARGVAVWPAINEFCALWTAGHIEALATTTAAYPTLPAKTLDKWYRTWRVSGVEALLERKQRKDKGATLLARDEQLHQVFIAALAEMHRPTVRQVARVIRAELGAARTPPEGTLKRWIRDYQATNKVALLKLKNPDAWRSRYQPAFGSRSEQVTAPNQLWEMDSTVADAMLVDPVTGEVRRHAIISCIDVFTRRPKFLVSRTSRANAVKALIRQSILDWGKPEAIKTDNGKDYTADDLDFALTALAIQHPLCTPFSPDQKPHVERVQGTLLHDLFPMLRGFVGHSVAMRQEIESGRSFAQRFGHRDATVELRLSPQQLQDLIDGWTAEYSGTVHSELHAAPAQVAADNTTHVLQIDARALDLFLMPVAGNATRKVTKRGLVLDGGWFAAPELAAVMGQAVRCRQDEADMGAVHVFALDGSYICRAVDHALLGINRSELAAKARAIEAQTNRPQVAALRQARNRGMAHRAAQAIYADRADAAIDAADNVARIPARVVMESTAAIESVTAPRGRTAAETQRASALAALDAPQASAPRPVQALSADDRYSAWVRMTARADAGEQLSAKDRDWLHSYQQSSEFVAWHDLHEGMDPLAETG